MSLSVGSNSWFSWGARSLSNAFNSLSSMGGRFASASYARLPRRVQQAISIVGSNLRHLAQREDIQRGLIVGSCAATLSASSHIVRVVGGQGAVDGFGTGICMGVMIQFFEWRSGEEFDYRSFNRVTKIAYSYIASCSAILYHTNGLKSCLINSLVTPICYRIGKIDCVNQKLERVFIEICSEPKKIALFGLAAVAGLKLGGPLLALGAPTALGHLMSSKEHSS